AELRAAGNREVERDARDLRRGEDGADGRIGAGDAGGVDDHVGLFLHHEARVGQRGRGVGVVIEPVDLDAQGFGRLHEGVAHRLVLRVGGDGVAPGDTRNLRRGRARGTRLSGAGAGTGTGTP